MHVKNSSVTICHEIQIHSTIQIEPLRLLNCACNSISSKTSFTETAMRAESVPAFGIDVTAHPNRSSALVKILESNDSNKNNDNDSNTDKTEIKKDLDRGYFKKSLIVPYLLTRSLLKMLKWPKVYDNDNNSGNEDDGACNERCFVWTMYSYHDAVD